MELFQNVIKEFEDLLVEEERLRHEEGGLPLGRPEIKILGQMSLLLDPVALRHIRLAATADVDALFSGNASALGLFRKALKNNNLVYDELSKEIWLPSTATFETVHDSELSLISRLDTYSALVAKAVKAPEKNKYIIEQALSYYGKDFEVLLKDNGVAIDQFKHSKSKGRRL